ncbi:hypothetical protein PG987_008329 [Apiospora arundinis]
MAEPQPRNLHEGATTGDVEDEVQAAKSAEDRKAAAAMASMGANGADDAGSAAVDQEAASKAMKSLGGDAKKPDAAVQKKVKVEAADVTLLVDQLDLTKPKATDLLKAHDGDAVKAMKAFIAVSGTQP